MSGTLPGYYYDEEKKKYFKVQANHVSPPGAKYAKSNVLQEDRAAKKRKTEARKSLERAQQTVVRSPSLHDPRLAGCGLSREIGTQRYATSAAMRDVAFASSFEPSTSRIRDQNDHRGPTLLDAQWVPEAQNMILVLGHNQGSYTINALNFSHDRWASEADYGRLLAAFHGEIASLDTKTTSGIPCMVATSSALNRASLGNVCFARRQEPGGSPAVSGYWKIGHDSSVSLDCKLNPYDNFFAHARSDGVSIHPFEDVDRFSRCIKNAREGICMALNWLDRNTLACGIRPASKEVDPTYAVRLYDIRSQGIVTRFRRSNRITAIEAPNDSGQNLLVTSSYDLSLYDLRILRQDRPLLIIPHLSDRTRLPLTTLDNRTAVTDAHGKACVYSLRTGVLLATLVPNQNRLDGPSILRGLHWYEDERGVPFLQACHGSTIQRWGVLRSGPSDQAITFPLAEMVEAPGGARIST